MFWLMYYIYTRLDRGVSDTAMFTQCGIQVYELDGFCLLLLHTVGLLLVLGVICD